MDPALEKLRAALEEYLAQGGDTPVAAEAQALMDALQGSGDPMGAPMDQAGLGGPPPQGDVPDPMAANEYPPAVGDGSQAPSLTDTIPVDTAMPPPQPNAKTFEGARAGAKDRLKKLNAKK